MIEKYTDSKYVQLPYAVPIPKKESWEQGYADGRVSIVEEFENMQTHIEEYLYWCEEMKEKPSVKRITEMFENHIKVLKGENK